MILLFLIKTQQAHLCCKHIPDSLCSQIEQIHTPSCFPLAVVPCSLAEELTYLIWFRLCSLDLAFIYNQYENNDMPIIMSIRLNNTERNVNKITPKTSMAIPRTRIQRSGVDVLSLVW
jgi:hypothetical protein